MNRWRLFAVLGSCLVIWLSLIPARGAWAPDEDRYLEVAREMKDSGHWLVPILNGQRYSEKPPLFFDAVQLVSAFHEGIPEWTAKTVSLLAGLATLFMTGIIARKLLGPKALWLAPLILGSMLKFGWQAQFGQIDMLLTMLVVAQIALGLKLASGEGNRPWGIAGMAFFAVMGVLAKGLVGCLLPWLILLAFLALRRDGPAIRRLALHIVIPATFVMVALWLIAAGLAAGWDYPQELVFRQSLQRYVAAWHHHKPFFYYLQVLLTDSLPYSLLLFPLGWLLIRERRWRANVALFPLVWIGIYLLFFSFSPGKRSVYIFPILPAVALLLTFATLQLKSKLFPSRGFRWALRFTAGIIGVALSILAWQLPSTYAAMIPIFVLGGTLLVAGCLLSAYLLGKGKALHAFASLAIASLFFLPAVGIPAVMALNSTKVPRQFVEMVHPPLSQGGRLAVFPVLIASVNFYSRAITPVYSERDRAEAETFLKTDRNNRLIALKEDFGDVSARLQIIHEGLIGDDMYLLLSARETPGAP